MSTHEQVNSLANQVAAITAYAQARGYEVIRSYEDAGVSGLRAQSRAGFKSLLALVFGGQADFEVILVYDVSRWGRFQDPDEAGHYEFLCAQEGVRIEYCAEPFTLGEGAGAALMKGLKRAMAAEFSRELAVKVAHAQARLSSQGYWQHGRPGYGLRRQLVDPQGRPVRLLRDGEWKGDPTHRTVLVAGPRRERQIVRRIHRQFTVEGLDMTAIARGLNAAGEPAEAGAPWTAVRVQQVLTNPKYMGDVVTRRLATGPDGRRSLRACEEWLKAEAACPALVSRKVFAATQAALAALEAHTDEVLLADLKHIADAHGVLSEPKLRALGLRHARTLRSRFGSLAAAYAQIGYSAPRSFPKRWSDKAMLDGLVRLYRREGQLSTELIDHSDQLPHSETYRKRFGSLALAFARIGFVGLTAEELASPVGRARARARDLRLAHWALEDLDAADHDRDR